jgi:predicted small lipoprotein YifL
MTPMTSPRRRGLLALLLLLSLLTLDACGKRGDPNPPPDEPNVYPRAYPRQ